MSRISTMTSYGPGAPGAGMDRRQTALDPDEVRNRVRSRSTSLRMRNLDGARLVVIGRFAQRRQIGRPVLDVHAFGQPLTGQLEPLAAEKRLDRARNEQRLPGRGQAQHDIAEILDQIAQRFGLCLVDMLEHGAEAQRRDGRHQRENQIGERRRRQTPVSITGRWQQAGEKPATPAAMASAADEQHPAKSPRLAVAEKRGKHRHQRDRGEAEIDERRIERWHGRHR